MKKREIKYGGMLAGKEERDALIKSIDKSIKTGNWQQNDEGKLLEEECAKFLKVKYGILTNSGSSAGLLALSALELPRGSEVIISACTFPTIFNIIIQCGLVPVVVDAKVGTYNFDVNEVENAITEKTRAIIAIHALGNPIDMPKLMKVVNKFKEKIYVIEDNCDGWGSSINNIRLGSFGDISITSFHAAHIVSMGVGGGVFTSDANLAKNVRMYRDWGRQANSEKPNKYKELPKDYNPRFIYEKIGYNFQILELQAAMGRVQLKKANAIKKARKNNFDYLYSWFENLNDVLEVNDYSKGRFILPKSIEGADVCWFAFPITYLGNRGKLVAHLEKNGIETRSMFSGDITKHPAYINSEYRVGGELRDSSLILSNSFWISCHPRMTQEDREYIIETFDDFFTTSNNSTSNK